MLNDGEKHLYEYNHGMAGGFMSLLFDAIFKADPFNKAKLALGFPEEVEAVRKWQNQTGYHDYIERNYVNPEPINILDIDQ